MLCELYIEALLAQTAERTIQLPDMSMITAKWRTVVEDLGNLSKLATQTEVFTARRTLQSLLGIVRVDRDGKGYADLGLPTKRGRDLCCTAAAAARAPEVD
jgi:hypothetical protein